MDLPEDQAPAPFAEWSPEALIEFMTNRICRRLNRADIRGNETVRNRLWGQHSVLCSLLQTCVENERNAGVRRRALDMMLNISDISPSSSELERRDDAMEEAEDNETESERRDDVSTLSQERGLEITLATKCVLLLSKIVIEVFWFCTLVASIASAGKFRDGYFSDQCIERVLETQTEKEPETSFGVLRTENLRLQDIVRDQEAELFDLQTQCTAQEEEIEQLIDIREYMRIEMREIDTEYKKARDNWIDAHNRLAAVRDQLSRNWIPDAVITTRTGKSYHTHPDCQALATADAPQLKQWNCCANALETGTTQLGLPGQVELRQRLQELSPQDQQDLALVVPDLQRGDKVAFKQKLSVMVQNGGNDRIRRCLQGLTEVGFDALEIQRWLQQDAPLPRRNIRLGVNAIGAPQVAFLTVRPAPTWRQKNSLEAKQRRQRPKALCGKS
ncbi:unnamed protein product [Durusdinium trenchii]|uniref:Uncharacterized protein n=1 Tax=Durusdinium trenchii TaxID=1381693 RepID=A0ABP0PB22_9DINO